MSLTFKLPIYPHDPIVVHQQLLEPQETREALQERDRIVREIYAVKLVLCDVLIGVRRCAWQE